MGGGRCGSGAAMPNAVPPTVGVHDQRSCVCCLAHDGPGTCMQGLVGSLAHSMIWTVSLMT
eukprot:2388964-Lingulodinium_polyedra.AAC.1